MSRALKASGFAGLAVQMLWGMYNSYLLMPGGGGMPPWLTSAHAHLGVLSILAVVLGFAVDHYDLVGRTRSVVTSFYIAGQWMVPGSLVIATGFGIGVFHMTTFLWGTMLFVSMALMTWTALSTDSATPGQGVAPADD